ncbi:hypothetical protein GQ53DRAFT_819907 [Thozetella sp. PMI_491]|nr:hypothetical protein GQ53DRAFT_819907 [Thozetella sp. PMI_491]
MSLLGANNPTQNSPDSHTTSRSVIPISPENQQQVLTPPSPISSGAIEISPGRFISSRRANDVIEKYRKTIVPIFPFVPLDEQINADELFRDTPILFRTLVEIVASAGESDPLFPQWFRSTVAMELVVKRKPSLELLQAIILLIVGNRFHGAENAFSDILHLAVGVAADLGLSRSPYYQRMIPSELLEAALARVQRTRPQREHTNMEIRAVFGLFLITSRAFISAREPLAVPFTTYMAQYFDSLSAQRELPTDHFLIAIIRLQRLAVRIASTFTHPKQDECAPAIFNESIYMTIRSFEKEIDACADETRSLYRVHFNTVKARLYESAIFLAVPSPNPAPTLRPEILWSCLRSCIDVVDVLVTLPDQDILFAPAIPTTHAGFANITMSRLLFLDAPDWDSRLARQTTNFPLRGRQLSEKFGACEQAVGIKMFETAEDVNTTQQPASETPTSIFAINRARLIWATDWYNAKLIAAETPQPNVSAPVGYNPIIDPPAHSLYNSQDLVPPDHMFFQGDNVSLQDPLAPEFAKTWMGFDGFTLWGV